jgi:hypothetical protein
MRTITDADVEHLGAYMIQFRAAYEQAEAAAIRRQATTP